MSFDGRDLGSGFTYQVHRQFSGACAAGSLVTSNATYINTASAPLYVYELPVVPESATNPSLTFIKSLSGDIGFFKRPDGGTTLISTTPAAFSCMQFMSARLSTPAQYGAVVYAADGVTVLTDITKNCLVVRAILNTLGMSFPSSPGANVAHALGYAPYVLAVPSHYESDLFVGWFLLVPSYSSSATNIHGQTNCYVETAGAFASGTFTGTQNLILTDGL